MHRIRNPAYRFSCTEGSNPSLSASGCLGRAGFTVLPLCGAHQVLTALVNVNRLPKGSLTV
jgi:hypothetical protein